MYIKPREGIRVPDPVTRQIVPAEGIEVSDTDFFWLRLVNDGGFEVVEKSAENEPSAQEKEPRNNG